MLPGEQNKKTNNLVRVKRILNVEKISPLLFGADVKLVSVVLKAAVYTKFGLNCKALNCICSATLHFKVAFVPPFDVGCSITVDI